MKQIDLTREEEILLRDALFNSIRRNLDFVGVRAYEKGDTDEQKELCEKIASAILRVKELL